MSIANKRWAIALRLKSLLCQQCRYAKQSAHCAQAKLRLCLYNVYVGDDRFYCEQQKHMKLPGTTKSCLTL